MIKTGSGTPETMDERVAHAQDTGAQIEQDRRRTQRKYSSENALQWDPGMRRTTGGAIMDEDQS